MPMAKILVAGGRMAKKPPQVTLISATPAEHTYTYVYQVGKQTVSVTFDGLRTDSYSITGERTPAVCAAIAQARRDHALLSL